MTTTVSETPNSSLKTRAKSGAILGVIILGVLYLGGNIFALMMTVAAIISVHEWSRMVTTGQNPPPMLTPLAATVTGFGVVTAGMVGNPIISFWFLLALCFLVFAYNVSQKGPALKMLILGILYIGFAHEVMIWLRNNHVSGLYHMLTLLCIVWASDISAYFSGKAIGGPKLAPAISPKKTWAGFIGSSIGAGLVAAGLACPWLVAKTGVMPIGGMGMGGYYILGFVLAMFGQAGDLLISIFKRHFGVKDTGALIPGHGGLLDRIDALLLVALIFGSLVKILG